MQLYAGALAYSTPTIKMSHESVFLKKKECHSYATISFLPELLKLKCASKSSGDLIKMQIWIQQLWDGA